MERIEDFVMELFREDRDKAGAPYYHHCDYVANYAKAYALALGLSSQEAETVYLAGLCHDVLEDKGDMVSEEKLVSLIGREATDLVVILTNKEGKAGYETYFSKVKKNRLASIVKLADANHNADITRFPLEERTPDRVRKSFSYMQHALELRELPGTEY